jgi:hypothetical protein
MPVVELMTAVAAVVAVEPMVAVEPVVAVAVEPLRSGPDCEAAAVALAVPAPAAEEPVPF